MTNIPIWDLHVIDDHLWIATSEGLFRFSGNTNAMTHVLKGDDIIFSMFPDELGNLWLGAGRGLLKYHIDSSVLRSYDTDQGILNTEFNRKSVTSTPDGQLWFGGINGITHFNPESITEDNPNPPNVHIADLRVITSDTTFLMSRKEKGFVLPWEHNTIEIGYLGLNFTNPSKNTYKYQLKGYDPDWVVTNQPGNARYVKLPAGSYSFNVQAANNDGLWSTMGDSIHFRVRPPLWRTHVAYMLYLLFALGLFQLFKQLRQYRLQLIETEFEKERLAKSVEATAIVLNNKTKVYLDTLKYIKSDGNYLEFITDQKTIIDRNKLKDILADLPPNFMRVHRSYVVNKNAIQSFNSTSIQIEPQIEIPLSRTFKSNLA